MRDRYHRVIGMDRKPVPEVGVPWSPYLICFCCRGTWLLKGHSGRQFTFNSVVDSHFSKTLCSSVNILCHYYSRQPSRCLFRHGSVCSINFSPFSCSTAWQVFSNICLKTFSTRIVSAQVCLVFRAWSTSSSRVNNYGCDFTLSLEKCRVVLALL